MPLTSRFLGFSYEKRAESYLRKQGLVAVAKNVVYRGAELDLIMRDGDVWVCIEVKYRKDNYGGSAAETIVPTKIRRMSAAFQRFLSDNGHNPNMIPIRLDAVVFNGESVDWIKNIGV